MSKAATKPARKTAEAEATAPTPSQRPALIMYDDAAARAFEPFALTRPIATLLAGTAVVWERWQTALQLGCGGVIAPPHLAEFDEAPGVVSGTLPAGTVIANSRFAPAVEMLFARGASTPHDASYEHADARAGSWACDGRVAAVRLTRALPVAEFNGGSITLDSLAVNAQSAASISGWWHDHVWDFVRHLPAVLADDIGRRVADPFMNDHLEDLWIVPPHTTVLGDHPVLVWGNSKPARLPPAVVEPHVVLDATAGPIMIESGAHIRSFTRIIGPCRIGRNSTIVGGDVTGCSIGPLCKIRGEISSSIVLGFSNKGHEGFIGHSYLGRWVNLGAGTTTSNLKNTYGQVALWTPEGIRDTGMQFLGTMFGDHVKTGIGMLLTTGTVLGAAANVYGSAMPPKAVAPFAWGEGEPYDTYRLDKFLSSAELMMGRRQIALSVRAKRQLSASFEHRWAVGPAKKRGSATPTAKRKGKGKTG